MVTDNVGTVSPSAVVDDQADKFRRGVAGHPVASFLIRRVAAGFATLIVVSMLIFAGTNLLPGNAAVAILGQRATPEAVVALNDQLGLNRPLTERYWTWLSGFATGDLGQSSSGIVNSDSANVSVGSMISGPLMNSALLALLAFLLLIPPAILVGVFVATRPGSRTDNAIGLTAIGVVSLPEFVTGSVLVVIFAVGLGWLPSASFVAPGESVLSDPTILVLPVITLLAGSLAWTLRFVRTSVAETLKADYVTAARLGGIGRQRVLWRYGVRNALAPTVQVIAQTAQWLVGGIVITEAVFAYPGIGQTLVQAVTVRDIPVVATVSFILAAFYVVLNIGADLAVLCLVPKLRTEL